MSTTPKPDYDALAEWAETDAPTVQPGTKMVRGTPEGHAALRAMLETGTETTEQKAMLARAAAQPDAGPQT